MSLAGTILDDGGNAGGHQSIRCSTAGAAGDWPKIGAGTLTLTAHKHLRYTGPTVVNAGTLKVTTLWQSPWNHAVLPATGHRADAWRRARRWDLSQLAQTIGSLSGAAGSLVRLAAGTSNSALTFGNAVNTTFAGTISGNGAITKNGSGAAVFSGVNSFNGATVVNAGTTGFGQP